MQYVLCSKEVNARKFYGTQAEHEPLPCVPLWSSDDSGHQSEPHEQLALRDSVHLCMHTHCVYIAVAHKRA